MIIERTVQSGGQSSPALPSVTAADNQLAVQPEFGLNDTAVGNLGTMLTQWERARCLMQCIS
jgi:hypothetical protein